MRNLLVFGLALGAVACSSAPDTVELTDVTVLGVRLQVNGDPDRATPNAGETVTASWLALAPEGPSRRGWGFAACIGHVDASGAALCSEAPFAATEVAPSRDSPRFKFDIPRNARVKPGDRLLLAAAECLEATPRELTPENLGPRCSEARVGTAQAALYQFDLGVDGVNHHPGFERTPVLRAGQPWQAADRADSCGDGSIETIHAGSGPVPLTFAINPNSRETAADGESLESLSVLHFASAGAFEQLTTDLDGDARTAIANWLPPLSWGVPSGGRVVRFGFALLDGRGGADFAERSLCVLP